MFGLLLFLVLLTVARRFTSGRVLFYRRPSDPAVPLVSTANLAALGGYKDPHEALKRYVRAHCAASLFGGFIILARNVFHVEERFRRLIRLRKAWKMG